MRILFVAPYPLSRIRIRSYGFVSQLVKQHEVTVLALCSNAREVADAQALRDEGIMIIPVQDKRIWKIARMLRALGTSQPLQVVYDASPRLRAAINAHIQMGHFDVVHIEFIRALGALPDALSIPVVWDAVDCISQLYEEGARVGATAMLRFIGRYEAGRVRAFERAQLQRFRHILVTSERDRQALLKLVENMPTGEATKALSEVIALPHGIDQSYFQQYKGPRQPETLIFSGKMSFHANIAGVLALVEHVLPLVWAHRPSVRLIIAGSNPPAKIRQLARDPRIEITGHVADLRPYIAQARIAVSPLPYAVGIQNKVLEAMALGTPVITSSHGAAGLWVIPEHHLITADKPEAFAAAILRLLTEQKIWDTLSSNGLQYINTCHNWEHIIRRLTMIYAQAVDMASGADAYPSTDELVEHHSTPDAVALETIYDPMKR